MIVVDASVLGPALADRGPDGRKARHRLVGEQIAAPQLIDLEVASILRRAVRAGRLEPQDGTLALEDLAAMSIRRLPHLPLLPRIWELRDNLSAYDAAYVALAEAIGVAFLTADSKILKAPGIRCDIEHLRRSDK